MGAEVTIANLDAVAAQPVTVYLASDSSASVMGRLLLVDGENTGR